MYNKAQVNIWEGDLVYALCFLLNWFCECVQSPLYTVRYNLSHFSASLSDTVLNVTLLLEYDY